MHCSVVGAMVLLLSLENATVGAVTELMQAVPQGLFYRNPKIQSSQAAQDATYPHSSLFVCTSASK